ncbi:hypothetical protein [Chryseobacterium jejuense]|uniref:hypothetical protein n=1 Tax=Chryseobacterium jejuense TaxID=445960 RepID=UPI001AE566AE|nr:hypothetical protein [Chryseobacterium jejuense]MBP2616796.1 hypothetical protein [Chryseobacterium jejuense]
MKTKILLLFLLWASIVLGQRKASIEQFQLFKSQDNKIEPTLFWAQYDATRRGSMLYVDQNQRIRMLSENPPDAAMETIMGITAKVKGLQGDVGEAEAAFNAQKSVADLAKRTAAVNMLRDALYRLNELYYATADEKKDIIQMLQDFKNSSITPNEKGIDINSLSVFQPSMSSNDIKSLFDKVITSTKEIAVAEASVDFEAEKSKQEQAKAASIKLNIINLALQKVEGNMSKEEIAKYIKEIEQQIK